MARQVRLQLDVTEFVRRGEQVFLSARAKGANWFGRKYFFFASDGGAVVSYGRNGSRGSIETQNLEPGVYEVKAHFEQGPSPLDQADACKSFVVTE
jgi:hypothetical protein